MDITYNWVISKLEAVPTENDLNNVVKIVHWEYEALSGEHKASMKGQSFLGSPESNNFIAYDSLSKSTVIEWLESKLNTEAMNDILKSKIEDLANPSIVVLPLPWV